MVNKILQLFNKEINGLHMAAYLLAIFAFLSQVLGLVRDRLLAHVFGAGQVLDVYYASFRIPDFIFVTVASLASLSVLVPLLIERLEVSRADAQKFIQSVFSFFFSIIVIVSLIAFVCMPILAPRLFPGLLPSQIVDIIFLSRVLLLSPIFLGISNIYASVTHALGRFVIYGMSPLVYNLGIVLGIVFLVPSLGILGVVIGVLFGAFFHMAIQIPFLLKEGFLPRFSYPKNMKVVWKIFVLSLPRTLALATTHISLLVLISVASFLSVGSISIFNLAFNLQSIPLSIIGVSYSLAVFPTLARLSAESKRTDFMKHVVITLKHVIFWAVPVTVLLIVLRAQIVRTILGSGAFDWDATRLTAACLALFVLSAVFQCIVLVFVRAYYATGITFKPLLINVTSAIVIVASSYLFLSLMQTFPPFNFFIESLLRVEDVPGTEILALPLGFTVGSVLNGLLMWFLFRKDFGSFTRALRRTLFEVVSASILAGFTAYCALNILTTLFNLDTLLGIFLQGFVAGIFGICIGILVLRMLGSVELMEMRRALSRRLFGASVVGPDAEVV